MSRVLFRDLRALIGDEGATRPAELLLHEGRIVRIAAPGDLDPADADETVALGGRTVLPGFVDGHCHLELTAAAMESHVPLHAPPIGTLADLLDEVARARAARPTGWIIGRSSFGLQGKVAEGRLPHRAELDRVSPDEPVVVLAGLHVACLNTVAMRELGLEQTDLLPGWLWHQHDPDGPTGVFTEVWDRLPTPTADEARAALARHALPLFTGNGVTSLSTIPTSADDVRALHALARDGELPVRVRYYVHVPRTATLDEVLSWGPGSGFGDDRLRFGGVKIFIDGEGADALGIPRDDTKWTRDELFDLVERADAAGVQLMMHAVTPAAIRLGCEAVAQVRSRRPQTAHTRHRIEHGADSLDVADLPLIRESTVELVATPHFASSSGAVPESFQPLRAVLDAVPRIIGASDSTGTVPEGAAPLANIAAAAARVAPDGSPSPHRITVLEAIRMFTSWSAYGAGEEHEKGRLAPGMLGDLVVLSADPLATPLDELGGIRVERTIVGGATVAQSSEAAA